jgi:group I intron endonuclease
MQYVPLTNGKQYVPGIYKIVSTCGKVYIGSAVTLRTRFMSHRRSLQVNKHDNERIQNYYNKHSENSLSFHVIEYCDREKLIEREQFYIDAFNPFFNIARIAGATYGLKPWLNRKHSEETKQKIKQTNLDTFAKRQKKEKPIKLTKEENIQRLVEIAKSDRVRELNRQRMTGHKFWLGRKHKPETIAARMGAGNGRARRIKIDDQVFDTGREAAKYFNVAPSTINNTITRGNKLLGKHSVSYAD